MKVQRRRRRRRRRGTMGTIRHLRQIIRILWVKIHSNIMGAQGYLRIMIHVLVCKDAVQHQTILLSFVWRLLFNGMLGFGLAFGCFGLWLRLRLRLLAVLDAKTPLRNNINYRQAIDEFA